MATKSFTEPQEIKDNGVNQVLKTFEKNEKAPISKTKIHTDSRINYLNHNNKEGIDNFLKGVFEN
ncbi:hypothetical protein [Aerococcus kribbianus]|uniref:Uncharacterized protein n=1 Tax=Aerococcus kribbianus TaxID=2999064 RepID=A0A9X3JG87_9LACT|nr:MULTISPECIES: hypothetical protein [unclassified Aerococcus]MCZ0717818.1 hypothetical protein [Aerococcus sp. YH-aer221]MCZ0726105.1 hypothetical protein [Aerococcus sp. YH-aer222]MDD7759089.1 hypothetical protein [Aerococcus suis]